MKFSGHETFNCRPLWLKKGIDFISDSKNFADEDSVVLLGIGKNMVSSINYWVNSFGLLNENKEISELAEFIFGKSGKDPFLEDPATLWLLHYYLVRTNNASIYNIFFNHFRSEKSEFTKNHLQNFIERYTENFNISVNTGIVEKDINVFLKTYLKPEKAGKNFEDEYNGMFVELNLIIKHGIVDSEQWYKINLDERQEIPSAAILFLILEQMEGSSSISFSNLSNQINSVGNCFALNEAGLFNHIQKIVEKYNNIVFTEDAGTKEIQMKKKINKWKILEEYYAI